MAKNEQLLKDVMCPVCFETQRFAVQVTMNVLVEDSGFDFMAHQPSTDHFPGRTLDEDDGFQDFDPISCANRNGCGYMGTFGEFRAHAKELVDA
jgi:uncharacterized protein (DUF2126 family)